jgi:hypothetical protein
VSGVVESLTLKIIHSSTAIRQIIRYFHMS